MENNPSNKDQKDLSKQNDEIEGTDNSALDITPINDDVDFENPSIDPGFVRTGEPEPDQNNDALNYKNDRENGAYNPKNI